MYGEIDRARLAVNLSILFTELPLLDRPAAARSAGFDAVEFWWPFATAHPTASEVDAFITALDAARVSLIGLNFFAGDMPNGQRGVVAWPRRTAEFRNSVTVAADIARRTGCRAFNALYGQRLDGVEPSAQDDVAVTNLAFAADTMAPLGGTVLIEALAEGENGAYPLRTAADVGEVIDRVAAERSAHNLRLLFDTYHLTRNGEDLPAVLDRYGDRVGHVQIADAPGRAQPGTGDIDFGAVFTALGAHHYRGPVACEYKPTGPSADSFGWIEEMC